MTDAISLKIGCAEQKLDIPLFAELYGYGNYCERRNIGVDEEMYCRAISFNDGQKRAMIIYTDTCTTSGNYAREMRQKIAAKYNLDPNGIAFVATHTHSAPALYNNINGFPMGIPCPEFQQYWKDTVFRLAGEALADEEDIANVVAGKALIDPAKKIGRNRVEREKNITDPSIRWAKFIKPDGTTKILLHNNGMHAVTENGSKVELLASSDWPGAVNRMIREKKLASTPLFMLGPAGDQMPKVTCLDLKNTEGTRTEANNYMAVLEPDLDKGTPVKLAPISYKLKNVEMPVRKQTADELRQDAQTLRDMDAELSRKENKVIDYWARKAGRLEEMALLLEQGKDLGTKLDMQVISLGDISFFFIPGELYIEPGIRLLEQAKAKYPFIATVANDNGGYFFTEDSGKKYPDIRSRDDKVFGFYEINLYMLRHGFRFENNIADFIVDTLLDFEKEH